MAKTTSQIVAENKEKNQQIQEVIDSRNAIHQQQMSQVPQDSAAKTKAVLENAGYSDIAKTVGSSYSAKSAKKAEPATPREEQTALKKADLTTKQKAFNAQKAYKDYTQSAEYKTKTAEREKQKTIQKLLTGIVDVNPIPEEVDEKEQRLKAEADYWQSQYEAEENQKVMDADLAELESWSDEDRRTLAQYATGKTADYFDSLNMAQNGLQIGRAEQQAAGLIQKYGQKRVDELAETWNRSQNEKTAQQVAQTAQSHADDRPVLSAIGARAANLAGGIGGSIEFIRNASQRTGRYSTLDPNNAGTIFSTYGGNVDSKIAENITGDEYDENGNLIKEGGALRQGLSYLYQGGMSAADSLIRAGFGAGGNMALAAASSFSQSVSEASQRGATPGQAVALGLTNAAVEAVSEKIPFDELMNIATKGGKQTVKQALGTALKQAGIEATTEEISLIGTVMAEAAILREKSDYNQQIIQAFVNGTPYYEAVNQANKDLLIEAAKTAAVSAISGGMSSAGASIVANVGNTQEAAQPQMTEAEKIQQRIIDITNPNKEAPVGAQKPQTEQQSPAPVKTQEQEAREALEQVLSVTRPQQVDNAMTAEEAAAMQSERAASLDDADAPPVAAEKYQGERNDNTVGDPFDNRDWNEVGKKNVKAYMYENPEVKPFFQMEAQNLLMELSDTTRGERFYDEDTYYATGGEKGYTGVKRNTSDGIAELLDSGFTYDQIEKGLNAIIQDNGAENNALSKRIEFVLNDRLLNGHKDFYSNDRVPASEDYVKLVNEKQINEYSKEAFDALVESGDRYAPPATQSGQPTIKGTGAAESNFSEKPAYNVTLSEDNAQADRRDDVRPMELPERDINGGNVSAVTGNVYASKITPDDFASLMEEPTARGDFSYTKITNDRATQMATETISRAGDWDTAYNQWVKEVDRGVAGAEMSARGALLLNRAAQQGNKQQWLNVLSDMQKLGTNTAQGLQALRIIRTLNPTDKIEFAKMSVSKMAEDMKLNVDIAIDQNLLDQYEQATTDQQRDDIMEKIQQNVADQIPSTALDKWTALRYTNMLGNLKTNFRNFAGNVGSKAVYKFKDSTAAIIERIANKVTDGKVGRTKSLTVNQDLLKACRADFEQYAGIVSDGGKYGDRMSASSEFAQGVQDKRQIFKNPLLERYRKGTNWMMNNKRFGDEAFGRGAYARALAGYLQANGVKDTDLSKVDSALMDKARTYAIKEAQEQTFHDNSALANIVSGVQKKTGVVGQGIMPFTKTPANVLTRAEEFSPLGLINSTVKSIQKAKGNTEISGTDVINSWSKTLTGTALFALGAIMQDQGLLAGGPDEDEDKEYFDQLNGYQNYAFQLPDGTNYTMDWLTPAAMPMFMGAQLWKTIQDNGGFENLTFADMEKVFTSIADPMLQMSMLQGLNDSLDNIKYSDNNLGQFFINAAVSYLTQGISNTLVGQLERSTEAERTTTYIDKDSNTPVWLQKQLGSLSQKTPGWDYQQTPYVNARGETDEQETGPLGFLYNLVSPGYVDKAEVDKVSEELYRLNDAGVEGNVFPESPSTTVTYKDKNGIEHKDYNLTAEQADTLKRVTGQTATEILNNVIESKDYSALSDSQKAAVVDYVYEYARAKGYNQAVDGYPNLDGWKIGIDGKEADTIIRKVAEDSLSKAINDIGNAWKSGWSVEQYNKNVESAYNSYAKLSTKAKNAIKNELSGTTAKYIESRENGVKHGDFLKVAKPIAETNREIDKRKIIAESGLSAKTIDTLMMAYMDDYDPNKKGSETTELKYNYIRQEMGLSPQEYVKAYEVDQNGGKWSDIRKGIMETLDCEWSVANELLLILEGRKKDMLLDWYDS